MKYHRPVGWRNDSHRHSLAAKGIQSGYYSKKGDPVERQIAAEMARFKEEERRQAAHEKEFKIQLAAAHAGVSVNQYKRDRGIPMTVVKHHAPPAAPHREVVHKAPAPTPVAHKAPLVVHHALHREVVVKHVHPEVKHHFQPAKQANRVEAKAETQRIRHMVPTEEQTAALNEALNAEPVKEETEDDYKFDFEKPPPKDADAAELARLQGEYDQLVEARHRREQSENKYMSNKGIRDVSAREIEDDAWKEYLHSKSDAFLVSLEKNGSKALPSDKIQEVREELISRNVSFMSRKR